MTPPSNLITGRKAKLPGVVPEAKRHKYNAQPTLVDGIRFASKREAVRYGELKLLEEAGEIKGLQMHPRFELAPATVVKGEKLRKIEYVADFAYMEGEKRVVEDVKGRELPMWRLKRNLFLRKYPYCELRIVKFMK